MQALEGHGTAGERATAITSAILRRQRSGESVLHWPLARLNEGGGWRSHYLRVEQFMTTDLTTVHPDEALDLVANLMVWERLRYVPVEDKDRTQHVGMLRMGIEPLERWAACASLARPELIVQSLVRLEPRQAAQQNLQGGKSRL